MILDPEAIRSAIAGFADLHLRAGREPVYGKLHARGAKVFFSLAFGFHR
jgi:hypothetical protein